MASEWRVARRQTRREEGGREEAGRRGRVGTERGTGVHTVQYSVNQDFPPDPIPDSRIRPLLSSSTCDVTKPRTRTTSEPKQQFFGKRINGRLTLTVTVLHHACARTTNLLYYYLFSHTQHGAYGVPSSWPCGLGMRACGSWDVHAFICICM
jgi:hypothetical protein